MKQFVVALTALLSCQETPKGYVINGEVSGMPPDGKIYLKSFRNKMFLM